MSLPMIMCNDFFLEVARQDVTNFASREIYGWNASVAGAGEDIWNYGGSIAQITAAALLCVSSTAVADAALAITVTGLDANYDEITETFALDATDGQVLANSTKAFYRVNSVSMPVAPAGLVYVYYGTTAGGGTGIPADLTKIQATVDIAGVQAYNAIYTVPRNKILYMTNLRYKSTASDTTHAVVLSIIRKLYGGVNKTVKVEKYVDLGNTDYVDEQIQITDQPIVFPPKSEFRMTASLVGGTLLNISVLASFVEESLEVADSTIRVYDKTAYLAAYTGPVSLVTYYLIGLDEFPTTIPSTFVLADLLATITGETTNYTVAADTEVAFDPAYFTSGKLIQTTKKAVLTLMRCIDAVAGVYYVVAPQNPMFSLGNCKKVKYLHV